MKQRVREIAGPVGMAGGAMAVCCTIHLIILAGGIGAATGILGGWLRSPYIIVAGLMLATAGLAAFIMRRARRGGGVDTCCPPATDRPDTSSASVASPQRTDAIVGADPRHGG